MIILRNMLESCDNHAMSEKRNGKRFRHHTEWPHMADVVIEAHLDIRVTTLWSLRRQICSGTTVSCPDSTMPKGEGKAVSITLNHFLSLTSRISKSRTSISIFSM